MALSVVVLCCAVPRWDPRLICSALQFGFWERCGLTPRARGPWPHKGRDRTKTCFRAMPMRTKSVISKKWTQKASKKGAVPRGTVCAPLVRTPYVPDGVDFLVHFVLSGIEMCDEV